MEGLGFTALPPTLPRLGELAIEGLQCQIHVLSSRLNCGVCMFVLPQKIHLLRRIGRSGAPLRCFQMPESLRFCRCKAALAA